MSWNGWLTNLQTTQKISSSLYIKNTLNQWGLNITWHFQIIKTVLILIQNSLQYIPNSSIDNKPALVQITAWRPQATSHYQNRWSPSLVTHTCVTRSRCANALRPSQMAVILQKTFSSAFSYRKIRLIQIALKFVPRVHETITTIGSNNSSLTNWQHRYRKTVTTFAVNNTGLLRSCRDEFLHEFLIFLFQIYLHRV